LYAFDPRKAISVSELVSICKYCVSCKLSFTRVILLDTDTESINLFDTCRNYKNSSKCGDVVGCLPPDVTSALNTRMGLQASRVVVLKMHSGYQTHSIHVTVSDYVFVLI